MKKPLVSIIIPVFNNEKYIERSINSALNQSYQNIEIIVVNDGSTDGSKIKLESFEGQIKLINQENKGAGAARNIGIKQASGEYIKFLDGDDILEKDAISKQVVSSLRIGNKKAIVYGRYLYIDQEGNKSKPKRYITIDEWDNPLSFLILNDYIVTTCPLHKKKYLEKYGGFTESFFPGEDPELHLRLFVNGIEFIYDDTIVYYYRQYNSDTRLSSVKWPEKKPDLGKKQLELYEKQIFEKFDNPPKTVLQALGNKHFKYGISLFRVGNHTMSDYHFSKAKKTLKWYQYKYSNSYIKGFILKSSVFILGKKLTYNFILN